MSAECRRCSASGRWAWRLRSPSFWRLQLWRRPETSIRHSERVVASSSRRGSSSFATAAAVQPDGKILLGGAVNDHEPPPPPPPAPGAVRASSSDFLAVRLNADGSLDPSFAGGAVRTPIDLANSSYDVAWAVAAGPDGTVVLGGDAASSGGTRDFAFVRYTSSGALDTSFSGDGIQTLDVALFDSVAAVAVQPDRKIVAAGRGGTGFTVVRLRADGSLDPTFGSGGIVNTPIGDPALQDEASALALLGDGRILVAGTADYEYPFPTDFALARYLPDGRLDQSFGLDGIVVTQDAGRAVRPCARSHADRRHRRCRLRRSGASRSRAIDLAELSTRPSARAASSRRRSAPCTPMLLQSGFRPTER